MENKVVRIIGPAAEVDALIVQTKANPAIDTQEISLEEIEREMRMVILLHAERRKCEAREAAEEFEAKTKAKLRKIGIV